MQKKCPKCNIVKDISCFHRDRKRKDGHCSWCKDCAYHKDNRKGRGSDPKVVEYQKKYREYYYKHREKALCNSYLGEDRKKNRDNDLTPEWIKENIINKSCIYCEEVENLGCDRIDNEKGHLKDNVVPCCSVCNSVRNRNFTVAEMLRLGQLIKEIKRERKTNG